jgi:hypothetical protein
MYTRKSPSSPYLMHVHFVLKIPSIQVDTFLSIFVDFHIVCFSTQTVIFTCSVWFLHAECNFQTQCNFDTHKCDYDSYNYDFNTHECEFHTQSVFLNTECNFNMQRVIFTRRVQFPNAVWLTRTNVITRHLQLWFQHAQVWFPHVQEWFIHAECDFDTYEYDYDTHGVWFTHARVVFTHERVEFQLDRVTLKRTN